MSLSEAAAEAAEKLAAVRRRAAHRSDTRRTGTPGCLTITSSEQADEAQALLPHGLLVHTLNNI